VNGYLVSILDKGIPGHELRRGAFPKTWTKGKWPGRGLSSSPSKTESHRRRSWTYSGLQLDALQVSGRHKGAKAQSFFLFPLCLCAYSIRSIRN